LSTPANDNPPDSGIVRASMGFFLIFRVFAG
jgi:hypothetical protein